MFVERASARVHISLRFVSHRQLLCIARYFLRRTCFLKNINAGPHFNGVSQVDSNFWVKVGKIPLLNPVLTRSTSANGLRDFAKINTNEHHFVFVFFHW
jgi:hypothetical protein